MPYINVNDVYIMDNTGKQVDDAVDYALANSNRNLLDNPWWGSGEVVNQRNITSTPANQAYCIDRWIYSTGSGSNAISLGANGITFTPVSGQYMWMTQRRQNANALLGKKVTGSILLSDGTIYSGAVTVTTGNDYMYFNDTVGFRFYLDTSNNVVLRVGGSAKTIRAVKLELGSYSTLENDVPPDYETEKRKCMAYFQRISLASSFTSVIGFGVMQNAATNVRINIPTSVPFREGATLSASAGTIGQILIVGNGQSLTATAVTARSAVKTGGVLVDVTVNGNATANQMYAMQFYTYSVYIDISADI